MPKSGYTIFLFIDQYEEISCSAKKGFLKISIHIKVIRDSAAIRNMKSFFSNYESISAQIQ